VLEIEFIFLTFGENLRTHKKTETYRAIRESTFSADTCNYVVLFSLFTLEHSMKAYGDSRGIPALFL